MKVLAEVNNFVQSCLAFTANKQLVKRDVTAALWRFFFLNSVKSTESDPPKQHSPGLSCWLFCLLIVYCTRFLAQHLCVVFIYFEIPKTSLINHLIWLDMYIIFLKRVTVGLWASRWRLNAYRWVVWAVVVHFSWGGEQACLVFGWTGHLQSPILNRSGKEMQRAVIRHTRCKPHKLWVEHQSKPHLTNVMLQTHEKVPLCLRCKCKLFTTFDIWLKSANPLLLPNELLPNGSKVPKKSGIGREKQLSMHLLWLNVSTEISILQYVTNVFQNSL